MCTNVHELGKIQHMLLMISLSQVSVLDSGEHVIGAAGEVHLGTCIKDLQERFAKVELRVSRRACGVQSGRMSRAGRRQGEDEEGRAEGRVGSG